MPPPVFDNYIIPNIDDSIYFFSGLRSHERVFRNFDGDITREIHPVSYAEKGENGDGTRYEYDKDGNCIRIRYAVGGTERRFYDADGNLTKQVLPEAYDAGNDDGAGYIYAYDRAGRLAQIQDPDGNILHTYTYNGAGQLTRAQTSIRREGDTTYYRVTAYTYDRAGNKIEEAYGQQEVECWTAN